MPDSRHPSAPVPGGGGRNPLERIAILETAVVELQRELARLRAQVPSAPGAQMPSATGAQTSSGQVPSAPRERPATPPQPPVLFEQPAEFERSARAEAMPSASAVGVDRRLGERREGGAWRPAWTAQELEALVGKYGMLALATVAALAAVGTFLGWAIARGMLGPTVRVGLGVVAASLTAIGGYRLRQRERSFGSTLLGLSLAMFHVCAWASGPLLHLVSPWVAFGFAAVVSVGLAAFAYREGDEPLWCVGFGGAAIAPFVTSTGAGSAALLAAYGGMVLLSGCWALQRRAWTVAERVLGIGVGLYVVALASMPEREWGPMLALALPLAISVVVVLVSTPEHVRSRLRAIGALVAVAAVRAGLQSAPPLDRRLLGAAIVAAALVWLVLVDVVVRRPAAAGQVDSADGGAGAGVLDSFADWLDGCWLPLAFLAAVLAGFDVERDGAALTFAAAAVTFGAFVWRRAFGTLRDAAAFGASVSAASAVVVHALDTPMVLTVEIAALAVVLILAARFRPSRVWVGMAGLAMVVTSLAALQFLLARTPYEYTPFGTRPSAVALAVSAAWGLLGLLSRRVTRAFAAETSVGIRESEISTLSRARRSGLTPLGVWSAAVAWAYVWVNLELAHAFTPATATLLLISYYASTGVASVWLGRHFTRAALRHIGLALAVLAALVAFNGARAIDEVAMRIAGYLVTAVFLLGIAYWYRSAGTARTHATT